jgi:hypothetical protein
MRAMFSRWLVLVCIVGALGGCKKDHAAAAAKARKALANELQPVALKNCTLARIGSVNDGGYIACENLMTGVESAYSYGIETEDNWGCQVSRKLGVAIHQYDCFTEHRPTCDGGKFVFHDECIGPKAGTFDGQPFDTLTGQIAKNGDSGKRLFVKMDVEGAEWDSLLTTDDAVLAKIDQFSMEMHGINGKKFIELLKKLKKTFYLVNVHFNNYTCSKKAAPLPATVFEVLLVNKRIGVLDPNAPGHVSGAPPDAPNDPGRPDCQVVSRD